MKIIEVEIFGNDVVPGLHEDMDCMIWAEGENRPINAVWDAELGEFMNTDGVLPVMYPLSEVDAWCYEVTRDKIE